MVTAFVYIYAIRPCIGYMFLLLCFSLLLFGILCITIYLCYTQLLHYSLKVIEIKSKLAIL